MPSGKSGIKRDGAGGNISTIDFGRITDFIAYRDGGLLGTGDTRRCGGDGHGLAVVGAGDRAVVGIAVVGGDPVKSAGGVRGVIAGQGYASRKRLGVHEEGSTGGAGVIVKIKSNGAGGIVAAGDGGFVCDVGDVDDAENRTPGWW